MRRFTILCVAVFLLLILAGCSTNRFSAYRQIDSYHLLDIMPLDDSYDKAVSDPQARVIFAMDKASQEIDIFRNKQKINSIGGLGFDSTNFQRLTDIGVDADGGLLALDSSQKLLRKFSPEGRVVAEIKLTDLQQPELFCVGGDGTRFVYDAAPSEIICYSPLDNTEQYRFGRFDMQQPLSLSCNHDYLYAFSKAKDCTFVFYLLGQYKETLPGLVLFDNFNNPVRSSDLVPVFSSQLPKQININSETIAVLYEQEIALYKISYVRSADATQ